MKFKIFDAARVIFEVGGPIVGFLVGSRGENVPTVHVFKRRGGATEKQRSGENEEHCGVDDIFQAVVAFTRFSRMIDR